MGLVSSRRRSEMRGRYLFPMKQWHALDISSSNMHNLSLSVHPLASDLQFLRLKGWCIAEAQSHPRQPQWDVPRFTYDLESSSELYEVNASGQEYLDPSVTVALQFETMLFCPNLARGYGYKTMLHAC